MEEEGSGSQFADMTGPDTSVMVPPEGVFRSSGAVLGRNDGSAALAGSRTREEDSGIAMASHGADPNEADIDRRAGMAKGVKFKGVPSFNFGYNVKPKGGRAKGGGKGNGKVMHR